MFNKFFQTLPLIKKEHKHTSPIYSLLEEISMKEIKKLFSNYSAEFKSFGPFGNLAFPFFEMGARNSLDLFGLDELIIFSFYWKNRHHYHHVLDLGANIGLHSTILSKCGYHVKLFEPDPIHFQKLKENFQLNNVINTTPIQGAISYKTGQAEFVRVLGNTTGSHLAGYKNPYGELECFLVEVYDIKDHLSTVDLVKMDIEGHEAEVITSLDYDHFKNTDMIVEIGSFENAKKIFDHLTHQKVNLFAQKIGWQKVQNVDEIPVTHHQGSLFISTKDEMPWT